MRCAGEADLDSYKPLSEEDHKRCEMAFTMKVLPSPFRASESS